MLVLGTSDSGFESRHPDKMTPEKISVKELSSQETLEEKVLGLDEHINSEKFKKKVELFCKEVLIKDNIVDSGNFAQVFAEENTYEGLCFKKIKPLAEPRNNVHQEGDILRRIQNIDEEVKTPAPFLSADYHTINSKGNPIKKSVLVMEKMNAITFREILGIEISQENRKVLPENFDPELFFKKLEVFFEKIHKVGVYHCDVSYANLMIEKETNTPIVIDFGEAFEGDSGEVYDPYGRHLNSSDAEIDLDIKKLLQIKEDVVRHIDKMSKIK